MIYYFELVQTDRLSHCDIYKWRWVGINHRQVYRDDFANWAFQVPHSRSPLNRLLGFHGQPPLPFNRHPLNIRIINNSTNIYSIDSRIALNDSQQLYETFSLYVDVMTRRKTPKIQPGGILWATRMELAIERSLRRRELRL